MAGAARVYESGKAAVSAADGTLARGGLRGAGSISGDGQTLGTGVVLGEPGFDLEKEEGETALGLDGAGARSLSASSGGIPAVR